MRRSACLSVALAMLVSLTVASAGAAGAAPDGVGIYVPAARGDDPDANGSPDKADKKNQKEELCPQEKWVIALPIEGLACILLLPKPPPDSDQGRGSDENGEGGLGSLFG